MELEDKKVYTITGRDANRVQARLVMAIADLEFACKGKGKDGSICDICWNRYEDGSCPKKCIMNTVGAANKWEWRG